MPRTVLLHVNYQAADSDGRSAGEIAQDLQRAIDSAGLCPTDLEISSRVSGMEVVLAEVTHGEEP